jgi:hypothetical protein
MRDNPLGKIDTAQIQDAFLVFAATAVFASPTIETTL